MPRVKKPTKPFRKVASVIKDYADECGIKITDVALRLGMCSATLYNKLNNPENFTLQELKRVCIVVNAPLEEVMEFAKKG